MLSFSFPNLAITTRNGTAKAGEDFKKGSATQVQFNPGQSEGMWKVKILPVMLSSILSIYLSYLGIFAPTMRI